MLLWLIVEGWRGDVVGGRRLGGRLWFSHDLGRLFGLRLFTDCIIFLLLLDDSQAVLEETLLLKYLF